MPPTLIATSVPIGLDEAEDLIAQLPEDGPLSWVRRGEGLVGWGVAAQVRTSGPTRFADAAKWWAELVAQSQVDDRVNEPGSGLVSFGSFAFADIGTDAESILTVPEVVIGRRGGQAWRTRVRRSGSGGDLAPAVGSLHDSGEAAGVQRGQAQGRPGQGLRPSRGSLTEGPGSLTPEAWRHAVAEATRRINDGELEKVVLARDVTAVAGPDDAPLDVRTPLAHLAEHYPMCWTFHVDGLFGATPELLVRRERGLVTSRVLAGTLSPAQGEAAELSSSSKDREEHEYAVRSVADALEPHCSSMNVPEAPYVLHLPNVMHLATDVTGVVRDGITSLELAAALHPSAAVGGTPRAAAVALIAELEGMDRGRYAAPVGWMDAGGDGEWGIALRSAQIDPGDPRRVRLFAGCGVVGSSDPAAELAESDAKLVPVRSALGL
ncbi:MAG: isochorismate synthase [Nocardioides sp.]|uniref:isochorismate synthase n=1 Tax=Nocardioides sp. TaxID=35761 RepID=UPI0039E4C394